jgi:hypothetical protein
VDKKSQRNVVVKACALFGDEKKEQARLRQLRAFLTRETDKGEE